MIARFVELLEDARRRGTAVCAFTCYDAETAVGVLQAAAGRPVIRTARDLPAALDGARLLSLHRSQASAVETVVAEKLASMPAGAPLVGAGHEREI